MRRDWLSTSDKPYGRDEFDEVAMLNNAFARGDSLLAQVAIGKVAKTHCMTRVAERTGLSRENLYRATSGKRDVYFSTIVKILDGLGLTLRVERKEGLFPK